MSRASRGKPIGFMASLTPNERRKFSKRRAHWCNEYQELTTFDPLMDDFIAGNMSFAEAAQYSIQWFRDWACDSLESISEKIPR